MTGCVMDSHFRGNDKREKGNDDQASPFSLWEKGRGCGVPRIFGRHKCRPYTRLFPPSLPVGRDAASPMLEALPHRIEARLAEIFMRFGGGDETQKTALRRLWTRSKVIQERDFSR